MANGSETYFPFVNRLTVSCLLQARPKLDPSLPRLIHSLHRSRCSCIVWSVRRAIFRLRTRSLTSTTIAAVRAAWSDAAKNLDYRQCFGWQKWIEAIRGRHNVPLGHKTAAGQFVLNPLVSIERRYKYYRHQTNPNLNPNRFLWKMPKIECT